MASVSVYTVVQLTPFELNSTQASSELSKETTLEVTKEGDPVKQSQPSGRFVLTPVDARMKQIIDEFEYLAVNGRMENRRAFDPMTSKYIMVPARPEPIAIPRQPQQ